jgi:hypothetical protein
MLLVAFGINRGARVQRFDRYHLPRFRLDHDLGDGATAAIAITLSYVLSSSRGIF